MHHSAHDGHGKADAGKRRPDTGGGKSEPEVQRPDVRPEVLAAILTVLSEDAGTTPYGLNIVDIKKIK